jgi:hypothetical protein
MSDETRTVITFTSTAFNTTEERAYFINPGCFGDDVAKWLIGELQKRGLTTCAEPGQEDFGWYLSFRLASTSHTFVVGYRADDATWIGWIERTRGFVLSVLGARKHGIDPAVAEALHTILTDFPEIKTVRWHFKSDFDKGLEERGASTPTSPK